MSQENVEIVRRGLFALERDDIDAAAEFWHPEISWRAIEGAPDDVGEMHGIEAARRYVEDWFDTFDDFRSEPEELIAVGVDLGVGGVHNSGSAKNSGIETELRYTQGSTGRRGVQPPRLRGSAYRQAPRHRIRAAARPRGARRPQRLLSRTRGLCAVRGGVVNRLGSVPRRTEGTHRPGRPHRATRRSRRPRKGESGRTQAEPRGGPHLQARKCDSRAVLHRRC